MRNKYNLQQRSFEILSLDNIHNLSPIKCYQIKTSPISIKIQLLIPECPRKAHNIKEPEKKL